MKKPFRHKWIAIIAAALSLSLLAAALALVLNGTAGPLRSGMETVSRPFLRLFSPVSEKLHQAETWFRGMESLRAENERLKEDLAALEQEAMTGRLARQENRRLRALLDLGAAGQQLTLESAWVVARTPDNWRRSVTLDKGTRAGIRAGQCVVDEHGALVGRVSQTGTSWCQVSLLTDPAFRLAGMGTNSGVLGSVEGDLGLMTTGEVKLTNLTQADPVQLGEGVVTFAAGETYPSGLVVGTVTSLAEDPGGLTQSGVITPAADLDRLGEVFVITAFREDK
ncbi:MAG: rod shape-determining protein MreC [Bacillota bacterium]|nr:rod shape-determining protein MreC [Bacillota bacterium]